MTATAMTLPERPLRGIAFHALLQLAVLVGVAAVLGAAVGAAELVRSAELLTLAGAVTVAACAHLLLRSVPAMTPVGATLGSATLAALAMVALAVATGGLGRGALALAAGAFLLVGAFGLTLALVGAVVRDRLTAATLLTAVAALAAAAPVWLGPIAERFASTGGLVDTIVAVSPLTYLAVLADHDYLRATWFYEHSVLGSLRYDYPTLVSQSVVYALPFVAAAALRLPHFSQSRLAKELFR